ncbi:putative transporter [Sinomonas cyclohexanicum]|uniref:Transporter n=1 Tax=Sinomonas cyclohexanicum TaxID=322009 RepID=A0ABM7PQG1_SINCY|nr:MFS transporter [Corynebacterium cyclohexanicum]BCT74408.1 putative transporter [Corynebacterium cyclohexanicum]
MVNAPRALRPFAHREYRVLIAALAVSIFGSGMWAVAMVYEVIALGGGPLELSLVATAMSVGLVAFVLLGGVAADRIPQRTLIIAVEAVNLLAVGTVAVLAETGLLAVWGIALGAFALGVGAAFFFPAFSAILPRILPPEDLLAANGMEGTMRPLLQQAAGPAAAGVIVGALSAPHAVAGVAVCHLTAFVTLNFLGRHPALSRRPAAARAAASPADGAPAAGGEPTAVVRKSVLHEMREGMAYTVKTPWLLWTLLWASVSTLVSIGPVEVLLPFVVRDQFGGGSEMFGAALAAMGVAGAVASLAMASFRLPRRYLTFMLTIWGIGSVPLAFVGAMTGFWQLVVALIVWGATGGAGMVIWGTLLQRRVPAHLLGRISSLDFFVSLAFMPVSMAVAGPLAQVVPLWVIFAVAGAVWPALGLVAILAARMPSDEIAHPLDVLPASRT